jgi:hypothetical protein
MIALTELAGKPLYLGVSSLGTLRRARVRECVAAVSGTPGQPWPNISHLRRCRAVALAYLDEVSPTHWPVPNRACGQRGFLEYSPLCRPSLSTLTIGRF